MTSTARWSATTLVLVLLAGCSGPPSADVDREEMRDDVRSTTQELVEQLGEVGLEPLRAGGSFTVCGESGYEYGAGALLRPERDLGATIDDAEALLTDDGWEVDASERGEVPFVNVSRGPLEVSVRASQIDAGDAELEVAHDCIDGERDDTPSFDSEPIDVGA